LLREDVTACEHQCITPVLSLQCRRSAQSSPPSRAPPGGDRQL